MCRVLSISSFPVAFQNIVHMIWLCGKKLYFYGSFGLILFLTHPYLFSTTVPFRAIVKRLELYFIHSMTDTQKIVDAQVAI